MKTYFYLALIAFSTTIQAGIISFLVSLGMSLLTALCGMYLFSAIIMLLIAKSATRLHDDYELAEHGGGYTKDQIYSEKPVNNQIEKVEAGAIKEVA